MSYDIAVWHASRPITTLEASEIYIRLCEEALADVEPYPGIQAFLAELTRRYAQIHDWDEDDIDDCPWTSRSSRRRGWQSGRQGWKCAAVKAWDKGDTCDEWRSRYVPFVSSVSYVPFSEVSIP